LHQSKAKDFIRKCLTVEPSKRPTAAGALEHPFLAEELPGKETDLLPVVRKNFNARRTLHAAIDTIRAINKLREGGIMDGALSISPENARDKPARNTTTGLWGGALGAASGSKGLWTPSSGTPKPT